MKKSQASNFFGINLKWENEWVGVFLLLFFVCFDDTKFTFVFYPDPIFVGLKQFFFLGQCKHALS